MKTVNWIAAFALITSLLGCGGGGGNAGTSPFEPSASTPVVGTSPVAIDVLASTTQLNSGSGTATITAVVTGAGNASLPGVAVRFAADSGVLTSVSAVTNENGIATAELGAGANKSNRSITVNVTSGQAAGAVQVAVTGTTLSFAGDTTIALGITRPMTITASDSRGEPISGLPITVSSSLGNTLSATTLTTNTQGVPSRPFTYTATRSGADVLTFVGGGVTTTASIEVSGEDFVFTSPVANTEINVGTPQALTVRYRLNGVAQAGRTVNFAATAGALTASSAVTNASGEATVSVSATSASPATLQADLVGGAAARATLSVRFVARTPSRLVLQVSPTAIGPNLSGSTSQQARLTATVTDANGNPVSGQAVNFNRTADPSGGNLSQASSITDSSGQATVQYIAGPQTTSSNGVQVSATVAGTAVTGPVSLTVNQSALFIALGTGNVIRNADEQTYEKDWVVYVTDANGNAVPGVELTMKILPIQYRKGGLILSVSPQEWIYGSVFTCGNEDANYNGQIDPGEDSSGNGNGVLDPGNVISVSPGIARTGANGRATVTVSYAENLAPWVRVVLRAEAVVAGTESSREAVFWVSGSSEDFSSPTIPPAGRTSPYGVESCASPN